MSARGVLSVVGSALGGLIGLSDGTTVSADPDALRTLLADVGLPTGDLDRAVRRFQRSAGLRVDGVAGPRTVHALARYAAEARELRAFERSVATLGGRRRTQGVSLNSFSLSAA